VRRAGGYSRASRSPARSAQLTGARGEKPTASDGRYTRIELARPVGLDKTTTVITIDELGSTIDEPVLGAVAALAGEADALVARMFVAWAQGVVSRRVSSGWRRRGRVRTWAGAVDSGAVA
jgi:hypothetical protein